jgi:hypothetical protein
MINKIAIITGIIGKGAAGKSSLLELVFNVVSLDKATFVGVTWLPQL